MPAHLTPLLLLLMNPLAGGGAVESQRPVVQQRAPSPDLLRSEFEVLRTRHARARRALEQSTGAAEAVDQAYRAVFLELSERGSGQATAWILQAFPLADQASRVEVSARLELYEGLLRGPADRAWMLDPACDVFAALRRDAAALGHESALALAETFARSSSADETRVAALVSAASMEARWTDPDPERRARARARHADVLARFPQSAQAEASQDALWRLSRLAVGKVAPDFITRDVEGNEIRLADLHQRVLVVEFWSAEAPGVRAWAAHRRALVERHLDEHFFLLGVNLDTDSRRFRHSLESLEVEWTNTFEGGLAQQPIWRVDQAGSNVVLDAAGVVRFVDVHGPALDAAVAALLLEHGSLGGPVPPVGRQLQGGATQGR